MRSDGLRLSPGARAALARRCGGACEACGLEWAWLLYVFWVDEAGPDAAANLRVLCSRCSEGQTGVFRSLLGERTLRERRPLPGRGAPASERQTAQLVGSWA